MCVCVSQCRAPPGPPAGFKSFSLTSLELQMLTNSCVKLQTVHSIPMTMNKDGELWAGLAVAPSGRVQCD